MKRYLVTQICEYPNNHRIAFSKLVNSSIKLFMNKDRGGEPKKRMSSLERMLLGSRKKNKTKQIFPQPERHKEMTHV